MAGDAVEVALDYYSVVEDNDCVRTLEFRGGPVTKIAMHSHPAVVAVALADAKVRFTLANGQSMELELNAGMAMYQDAADHAREVLRHNKGSSQSGDLVLFDK